MKSAAFKLLTWDRILKAVLNKKSPDGGKEAPPVKI